MQDDFNALSDHLTTLLQGDEAFTCGFQGEDSSFVRFNHGKVRQAGSVRQRAIALDWIRGRQHAAGMLTLTGDREVDLGRATSLATELRGKLSSLPEDPYLLYATDVHSTERLGENRLPDPESAVGEIQAAAADRDLVGIYAAGEICAGFSNSLGQRNWDRTHSYNFDWSFHHTADKAVKSSYAGFAWDADAFKHKVDLAGEQLEALKREPKAIAPGRYRVYLAPAAVHDILGILAWGGFGLKAHRTRQTPLLKLAEGDVALSPAVTVSENTAEGTAPNFQEKGFLRPDRVDLIREGKLTDWLVSPRSAQEYDVPTNGASAHESPLSIDMGPGEIAQADVLQALGTGIYIGNVWYLNYSDRSACRTTGMTRFATFWVEEGRIVAPLDVMRFDETIYRMLGDNLVGLTKERDWILASDTYGGRSTDSGRVPGALVEDFAFTL